MTEEEAENYKKRRETEMKSESILTTQTYNIVYAIRITALNNTYKKNTKTADDPFPQRNRRPTGQPISS